MLASVINESFASDPALVPKDTPIIVCFSERERPGRLEDLNERVLEASQRLLDFNMHSCSMTVSPSGPATNITFSASRSLFGKTVMVGMPR